MSKQINVNIRMDSEIKEQADKLFSELGFNLTTAINAFVRQALRERAIPFYIKANDSPPVRAASTNRSELISRGRELGKVLTWGLRPHNPRRAAFVFVRSTGEVNPPCEQRHAALTPLRGAQRKAL